MTDGIFIVGAGAVGGSLAVALVKKRVPILGIVDPNIERAREIAEAAGGAPHFGNLPGRITGAGTVIVAVPDPLVSAVAQNARDLGRYNRTQVWLHVSGTLSAAALAPIDGSVRAIGTFHPAAVFAPERITEIRPGTCFAVQGDDEAMKIAGELARNLGGKAVGVPTALRPLYHAATVLASNYVVALLAEARSLLARAGLAEESVEPLLASLAASAVERAAEIGIDASLSGPIRRGDDDTVALHLDALKDNAEAKEIYGVLGRAAVRLANRTGRVDAAALRTIASLFEDER